LMATPLMMMPWLIRVQSQSTRQPNSTVSR
jgi:hypothetical protein